MRLYIHSFFNIGFMLSLLQYYEYLYTLVEHGLENSLWYSTTGGLHHGYYGFVIAYISYILLTKKDYESHLYQYNVWYDKLVHRLIMYLTAD